MSHYARRDGEYGEFPAGTVNWLRQDENVLAGYWHCTPEQQPDIYEAEFTTDETIYLIEGKLRVEIVGDATYDLSPGDSASFLKGTVGRWKVLETVTEFFIYH
ncbi:cupin domain-containing protein [Microbacterium gorillae]|uniref:cupin domain-containing protein n=1 Tax=Microbacterium gorillae TaxID=1231063 RepID=UPI00058E8EBE|nr:cupin domain-containing protein [Microbacterium gorillae]